MEKTSFHSETLPSNSAGRRYFFDLKQTENGKPYIAVTESRKDREQEGQYLNARLLVFQEDLEAFASAFGRLVDRFRQHRVQGDTAGE